MGKNQSKKTNLLFFNNETTNNDLSIFDRANKKYTILTYGCQMNERDSEIIGGILEGLGYQPSEDITQADLILFNTCSIRDSAERKIYGKIGEIKRLKNNNPDLIIGVAGCMAQKDREKIAKKAPHVDFILGTNNLHKLPELITRAKNSKETLIDIVEERAEIENEIEENRSKLTTQKIKASVNIMYGCNNFCTYCIVPYVRGREKSRPFKQIIEEIEQLGKEGVKEVTLLGQNVNSYGKDLGENIDFADLLAAIDNIPGIERIRYMTSHPRDFSDKLIQVIKNSSKVCEHFHLPIQSGCDKILRDMNRGYTTSQYAILVEKIRQSNPNASITTDIIVGFPGETEEDFEETLNFIKKIKFDQAYTFIYSRRSGTPAANLPNQIPLETKKQRLQQLISVQNEISLELNKNYIGKTVEVLVEGTSKNNPEKLTGRTRTNKIVIFSGDQQLTGQLVMVKIDKAKTWTLEGKILKD